MWTPITALNERKLFRAEQQQVGVFLTATATVIASVSYLIQVNHDCLLALFN